MTKETSQPGENACEADHSPAYDLVERTACFGEAVIELARQMPRTSVTFPIIRQFVRAGTSVGANYCEADEGVSKKDFRNKIGICTKEAKETKYWLRMIGTAAPEMKDAARELWQEAKELHLIFAAIFRNTTID